MAVSLKEQVLFTIIKLRGSFRKETWRRSGLTWLFLRLHPCSRAFLLLVHWYPCPYDFSLHCQDESKQVLYLQLMSRIVHTDPFNQRYGTLELGVSHTYGAALQKHGSYYLRNQRSLGWMNFDIAKITPKSILPPFIYVHIVLDSESTCAEINCGCSPSNTNFQTFCPTFVKVAFMGGSWSSQTQLPWPVWSPLVVYEQRWYVKRT